MRPVFSCLQQEPAERLEVNAFILSHIFWPTFREEKLTLPDFIQTYVDHFFTEFMVFSALSCHSCRELEKYVECYKSLKGLRTLEWKSHLGLVQVPTVNSFTLNQAQRGQAHA